MMASETVPTNSLESQTARKGEAVFDNRKWVLLMNRGVALPYFVLAIAKNKTHSELHGGFAHSLEAANYAHGLAEEFDDYESIEVVALSLNAVWDKNFVLPQDS